MSALRQGVAALVILGAAGFAWLKLDPGAVETLERYQLDHPFLTALASPAPESAGGEERAGGGRPGGDRAQDVVVSKAGTASTNDRVTAIGDGQAIRSVDVTPYVTGTLSEVLVQSGQRVEEGDVVARLDAAEQQIAVERARLALEDAENSLGRLRTLREGSASISAVQVTDAELAVQTAQLQLREAELNLSRRSITAPISGIIGIVSVNPGDYVTTDADIVQIDDRSELLVDFWVPERFASMVEVGQPVTAYAVSSPDQSFEGEVRAIDNRVDLESRTLWVRAAIPNEDDRLRAGMAFSVTMNFDGDTFPTVNPLSVQWSSEGSFVWRVNEGVTERVPVRIVQRNSDSVLVEGNIAEGDQIVTEGLMQLREGAEVLIADSGTGQEAAGGGSRPLAENTVVPEESPRANRSGS